MRHALPREPMTHSNKNPTTHLSSMFERLDVKFVRHRSPTALLSAMLGLPPEEFTVGGYTALGEDFECEGKEMAEAITRSGCYGFCDTRAKPVTINYWVRTDKCSADQFRYMLAHELGHACEKFPQARGVARSEILAERYAAVTDLTNKITKAIFKKKA